MNQVIEEIEQEEDIGCIAGAVLQVKPGMEKLLRERIQQYESIELHAEDERSRWVITLEAKTSKKLLKLTEEIQNLQGVLSVTPVYQHCEENMQQNDQGGWRWR